MSIIMKINLCPCETGSTVCEKPKCSTIYGTTAQGKTSDGNKISPTDRRPSTPRLSTNHFIGWKVLKI